MLVTFLQTSLQPTADVARVAECVGFEWQLVRNQAHPRGHGYRRRNIKGGFPYVHCDNKQAVKNQVT